MERIADILEYEDRALAAKRVFSGLTVELAGSWVWVSGDTKPKREALKAHGFRWAPKKEKWYLVGRPCASKHPMSWEYIASKYGAVEVEVEVKETVGAITQ